MRHLDDEVRPVERREPVTLALRPVVAAAEARTGNPHDGPEHDLPNAEDQRQNRKTPQGVHLMLRWSRWRDRYPMAASMVARRLATSGTGRREGQPLAAAPTPPPVVDCSAQRPPRFRSAARPSALAQRAGSEEWQ